MSVGTIVTIVLLMSVLVLGIFLVQRIFESATGAVDLTDEQLQSEINQLFGDDDKIAIYPSSAYVEIEQEDTDGVGIGIKNLVTGSSGTSVFSYEVTAGDTTDCGVTKEEAEEWIISGKSEEEISIASGDMITDKILFRIPVGAPLCVQKFWITVSTEGETYATASFYIEIVAS